MLLQMGEICVDQLCYPRVFKKDGYMSHISEEYKYKELGKCKIYVSN